MSETSADTGACVIHSFLKKGPFMPSIPSAGAIGRGFVITLISLAIYNFVKPYTPAPVRNVVGL
jgi:hypothetical protein